MRGGAAHERYSGYAGDEGYGYGDEVAERHEARLTECEESMGALMTVTGELCERMNLIEEMMALMADETLGLHEKFEQLQTTMVQGLDNVKREQRQSMAAAVNRASIVVKQKPMFGESDEAFKRRTSRRRSSLGAGNVSHAPPPLTMLSVPMLAASKSALAPAPALAGPAPGPALAAPALGPAAQPSAGIKRLRRASMQLATRRASMGTRNAEFFAQQKADKAQSEIEKQVEAALAFQMMTPEEQEAATRERMAAAQHEDEKARHLQRIAGTTNAFRGGGGGGRKKKLAIGGRKKRGGRKPKESVDL